MGLRSHIVESPSPQGHMEEQRRPRSGKGRVMSVGQQALCSALQPSLPSPAFLFCASAALALLLLCLWNYYLNIVFLARSPGLWER